MQVRASVSMVAAVVAPVVVAAALLPFRECASSANLALVLVVVVVGVAITGTRSAAVTCAVVTALAYDLVLTEPYGSFRIAEPDEVVTAFVLLIVGIAVGGLSYWARQQRGRAGEREEELGLLFQVIDEVSMGASNQSLIAVGEREITDLLGAKSCHYVELAKRPDAMASNLPYVDRVGAVHIGDLLWPAEEAGLPAGGVEIPMWSGGLQVGSFVVDANVAAPVPRWHLLLVVMVADLIASSIARWPIEA